VGQLDEAGPIWRGGTGQTWTPIRGTSVQSAGGRDTGDTVVIDSPLTTGQTTYVGKVMDRLSGPDAAAHRVTSWARLVLLGCVVLGRACGRHR
jgi:hypothetical protein